MDEFENSNLFSFFLCQQLLLTLFCVAIVTWILLLNYFFYFVFLSLSLFFRLSLCHPSFERKTQTGNWFKGLKASILKELEWPKLMVRLNYYWLLLIRRYLSIILSSNRDIPLRSWLSLLRYHVGRSDSCLTSIKHTAHQGTLRKVVSHLNKSLLGIITSCGVMGLSKLWRHVWSALWLSPTPFA